MGLTVGQIQTTLERRYSELRIVKDLHRNTVQVVVAYADGFYAQDGSWRTVDTGMLTIEGDAVLAIMGLTPSRLGLNTSAIGVALDTAIYGVLSGQIPLRSTLSVRVVDQDGKPVRATVSVAKGEVKYGIQQGAEVVFDLPVLVGVKVLAEAEGYQPASQDLAVLQGEMSLTLTLTPQEG
jgi:hypothetical protein